MGKHDKFNPIKAEFTIVIFIHYRPRIGCRNSRLVVDEDDLEVGEKLNKIAMYCKPVSFKFSF